MTPHRDPFNVRWGDVRGKIKAELEGAKDSLVNATPDRVAVLQGKAQALQSVIAWFEHGAIAEAAITHEASTPTTTPLGGY